MSGYTFFIIVIIIIFIIIEFLQEIFRPIIKCPNCGYQGKTAYVAGGCSYRLIQIILFLFLIIPCIIYTIYCQGKKKCPRCGYAFVVPVDNKNE